KAGAGSMQGVMRSFEPSTFDEKFIIRNALTKEPLPGRAYKITMPDGSVVSGVTDASGSTSLNSSDVIDNMIISLVKAN
ncbi:VgrG protein, partial [Klebsiella quasipneumoniae subsp. quasipneumoniae]|nr:VgrG protein [Klebsiella quasipneumoniae subsp. quasipneumoniae]